MTRAQKVAKAQKLRAQGLTFDAIGERLGVTGGAVCKWLNPERTKEWNRVQNLRRRDAKREWERGGVCAECEGPCIRGSELCADCRHERHKAKVMEMLELRKQGLLNYEIAERFGLHPQFVTTQLSRPFLRRFDLEYIPTPYWSRKAA